MRIRNFKNLINTSRLKKLRQDFKNPLHALFASSGIFKRHWKLCTRKNTPFLTNRDDAPIWDEYFNQRHAVVEIKEDLFHIIPKDPSISDYFIKGSNKCLTFKPQRWSGTEHPLITQLESAEKSVYSQNGEDGVAQYLLDCLPQGHNFIVEFGAYDGVQMSNSRYWIKEKGWAAYLIEPDKTLYKDLSRLYQSNHRVRTQCAFVTEDNINDLFKTAGVPQNFDILSIDIDSIDYYVWRSLMDFSPRMVIIEHNSCFKPPGEYVVSREKAFDLAGTAKEGASLQSFYLLGIQKGYHLIYCELFGANLFFIHESCISRIGGADITPNDVYQPPQFGVIAGGLAPNGRGYPLVENE